MPRGTREGRQLTITEVQSLINGGATDSQVIAHLMKKDEAGKPRFSSKTARRYLRLAYAAFNRDARRSQRVWLSTAIAHRQHAMRKAMTRKRHVVVDGRLEAVDDPDLSTYLSAVESITKLLGLNAPERHEVVVASFRQMFADLVAALEEEIEDVALLARVVSRLRLSMEQSAGAVVDGAVTAARAIEGGS